MPKYVATSLDKKTRKIVMRVYASAFYKGFNQAMKDTDPDTQMAATRTKFMKENFSN